MFKLTHKVKRLEAENAWQITIQIENDGADLVAQSGHEVSVRPRRAIYTNATGEHVLMDPLWGRSVNFEALFHGTTDTVCTISDEQLENLAAQKLTIEYGVVKEFVQWYEPLEPVEIVISEPTPEIEEDLTPADADEDPELEEILSKPFDVEETVPEAIKVWTAEELKELEYSELCSVAKELDVVARSKEDKIQGILDKQEE